MDTKKVLIAGGGGHLGSVVVRIAVQKGWAVRALDRNVDRIKDMESQGVEMGIADVMDKESLRPHLKGVNAVISAIGLWREAPPYTFDSIDRQGNINLFEVAKDEGIKKVVYVSLLNCEKAKKAKVMLAKRAVELWLEGSGLDYTVFRPSGLFHDFVQVFRPQILKGMVRGLGDGSLKMQPLSPEDLSICMVASLENPKVSKKIFNVGGPEIFTYDQAIKMVAGYLGKQDFKISYSPFWVAKAMAYIMNWIKPGSFLQPDWIELLTFDSVADPKPIKETFGIELKGIRGYLEEHLKEK
jgi:uncharacterized protein YbjT (DUF2867 family)